MNAPEPPPSHRSLRRAHGLTIDSDPPLNLPEWTPISAEAGAPDPQDRVLRIRRGTGLPRVRPGDDLVLSWNPAPGRWVRAARHGDGYLLEFSDVLSCQIDAATSTVTVEQRDPAVGPPLLEGWVLAFVLAVRGRLVLHASAVCLENGPTIAFAGASGSGKSTLAAHLCQKGTAGRQGAAFVTDDVAHLSIGATAGVHRGGTTARLRPAAPCPDGPAPGGATRTPDGRLAVDLDPTPDDCPALSALLIPVLDTDADRLRIDWLARPAAVAELLRRTRVHRWHDLTFTRRELDLVGDLVQIVPVGVARVPWGPRPPADLSEQLALAVTRR